MSQEDYIRRSVSEQMQSTPSMPKVEAYQVPDHWHQQVINDQIERERQRRDDEARRAQQSSF